jgi:hypothetical protein
MRKSNVLDTLTVAKLGVWLDDPHGDGIRLFTIRNPSPGRMAALNLIAGTPVLGGDSLIRAEYGDKICQGCFTNSGKLTALARRVAFG